MEASSSAVMNVRERINLHLFASPVVNESRLIKEAADSLDRRRFDRVVVLGFWEAGLAEREIHSSGLEIERCVSTLRRLQAKGLMLRGRIMRLMLKLLFFMQYAAAAFRITHRLKPRYISVHNPLWLPVGAIAAWHVGAGLVYLPHELEAKRAGISKPLRHLLGWAERLAMPACDGIVVVCEPIAQWYRSSFKRADVYTVRNAPRGVDVVIRPVEAAFRDRLPVPDDCLLFIYQGLIDRTRGCPALVEAMASSMHHMVFMGYGDYADAIASSEKGNVHHWPAVPLDLIVSQTAGADVGVFVISGELELSYALSLPNKFFEYLHAGLPVIVSDNLTYLSTIVRQHGLGWSIAADDFESLMASLDRAQVSALSENVRRYARDCLWEADSVVFDKVYVE